MTRPELPPGYEYSGGVTEGDDTDIVRKGVQDYRLALVAWYNPRNKGIRQRTPTHDTGVKSIFFEQTVKDEEDGLAILATRLWLGMTS